MLLVGLALLSVAFFSYKDSVTGRALLEIDVVYRQGEPIDGDLRFRIKEGELIPKDSQITISLADQSRQYLLSDLILDDPVVGNFYAEDSALSGEGEGYGVEGIYAEYPELDFDLRVFLEDQTDSGSSTGSPEPSSNEETTEESSPESEVPVENPEEITEEPAENPEETPTEETTSENEEPAESSSEGSSSESGNEDSGNSEGGSDSGLTGEVIGETEYIVTGNVRNGEPFTYNLEEGWSAEIVEGTVEFDGEPLNDNVLRLSTDDGEAEVTTEYFINRRGYGEQFLGDYAMTLHLDLSELDFRAESGTLSVEMTAGDVEIASINTEINAVSTNETFANATSATITNTSVSNATITLIQNIPTVRISKDSSYELDMRDYFSGAESYTFNVSNISGVFEEHILTLTPDLEFKGSRNAIITAFNGDESLDSNRFVILVSSGAININKSHEPIKVGEKVKWTQEIDLDIADNVTIELPPTAENITVEVVNQDGQSEQVDADVNPVSSPLTGQVTIELKLQKEPLLKRWFRQLFSRVGLTGNVINVEVVEPESGTQITINEETPSEQISEEAVEVTLDEGATEYVIEYYTTEPTATELETDYGKEVIVSAPDELEYTNVLSFTDIPEVYEVGQESNIQIFWVETQEYLPFDAYDLDGNDMLDYVEWNVPHLSNQTFWIILITDAQHLNMNRTFISDIYPEVRELDGNWSETIPAGDYVRVTFEQNLTSVNDITIYPRTVSGTPRIDIYEKDGEEIVAAFDTIVDNQYNKVFLNNLTGSQDTFDLHILDGSLEFDHIIDPFTDNSSAVQHVYDCGVLSTANGVYVLNQSIAASHTCLNVTAHNVSIDGAGYSVFYAQAANGFGIVASGFDNLTIKNLAFRMNRTASTVTAAVNITNSRGTTIQNNNLSTQGPGGFGTVLNYAVLATNMDNSTITGNNFTLYSARGNPGIFLVTHSDSNLINNNSVIVNGTENNAIRLEGSSHNTFSSNFLIVAEGVNLARATFWIVNSTSTNLLNNTIEARNLVAFENQITTSNVLSANAIFIDSSSLINLSGNLLSSQRANTIFINGTTSSHFDHVIDSDNRIHGFSINFTKDVSNIILENINNNYGQIIIANSNNITIRNSNLSVEGIAIYNSPNLSIINNNITANNGSGIQAFLSPGINISGNRLKLLTPTGSTVALYEPLIRLMYSNNSYLANNDIVTTAATSTTVPAHLGLYHTHNSVVNNLTISGPVGVYLLNSNNNQIANSSIYTYLTQGYGIRMDTSSGNRIDSSSVLTVGTLTSTALILLGTQENNTIINSNLTANSTTTGGTVPYGIHITSATATTSRANNIRVIDSAILSRGFSDIFLANSILSNSTLYVINTTFADLSDINFTVGSNITVFRQWYLDVNVTSGSPLQGATVTGSQANGTRAFNETTAANGFIARQNLTEYIQNFTGRFHEFYSNYTINTTLVDYVSNGQTVNMTTNMRLDVSLASAATPDVLAPNVTLLAPANASTSASALVYFAANVSDNVNVSNATLYVWNSTALVGTSFTAVGVAGPTTVNLSLTLPRTGTYLWNYLAIDNSSNQAYNNTNFTLVYTTSVSACQNLNVAGTTYTQTANIIPVLNNACINITAPNITYDCSGSSIANASSAGIGIYSNQYNTTIKNCNVTMDGLSGVGIKIHSTTLATVINSTLNSQFYGLHLSSANNSLVENITANANTYAVQLSDNSNYNIIRRTSTSSNVLYGVILIGSSYNNITNITSNSNDGDGVTFTTSSHNNILTNAALAANSDAIHIDASANNTIVAAIASASTEETVEIIGTASSRNSFVNSTFRGGPTDVLFSTEGINGTVFDNTYAEIYSFTGLGGLVSFTHPEKGQILFLRPVNGSGSNISRDVQINNNFAFVNESSNLGLNRTANVTFYNMPGNFVNPSVLRNGAVCTTCYNFTSLNSASVVFNVTGWSNYTIGETPDTGAPLVTINSPLNVAYHLNNFSIIFNVTLNENGTVFYSLNNADNFSMSTTDNRNFNASNASMADGSYIFRAYANDTAGNRNYTESVTFSVNNSLVSACTTLSDAGRTYYVQNNLVSTGTCFQVTANGITLNANGYNITGTGDVGINASGRNNFTFVNGRVSGYTVSISGVPSASASSGANIYVTSSTVDSISTRGTNAAASSGENGGLGGQIRLVNSAVLASLNAAGGVGDTAGGGVHGRGGAIYFESTNLNISGISINQSNGVTSGSATGTIPSLTINYSDRFEYVNTNYTSAAVTLLITNRSAAEVKWLSTVTLAGTLNLSNNVRLSNNNTFVNGSAISALNARANITLYGMGGLSAPAVFKDGAVCTTCYNFTPLNAAIVVFNTTGFTTIGTHYISESDVIAPTIDFVSPTEANNALLNRNNVLINVTSVDANLANITIELYNSTGLFNRTVTVGSPNYINISGLIGGIYTFNATARDTFGNVNYTSTRTVTVDIAVPLVSIVYPQNITYSVNVTGLNYTVSDANLLACWYTLNGGTTNVSIACGTNATGLVSIEGSNTWTVYANDTIGNVNSSSVTFFKDTLAPTIQYVSPTQDSGAYLSNNYVRINVTASDSALANITIRLFNTTSQVNSSVSATSPYYVNISGLSDGLYVYNASAMDILGNSNNTETRNITLDTIRPLVSYSNDSDINNSILMDSVYVNVTVTEINFANITFSIWNATITVNMTQFSHNDLGGVGDETRSIYSMNFTNLPDGRYFVQVNVTDLAGNMNATEVRTYTVLSSCINDTNTCIEGSSCTLTNACILNNNLCTGATCDFTNFTSNSSVYTLFTGNSGNNLTIITGNMSLTNGNGFHFYGRNASVGGPGGILNITTPGLFNRTIAVMKGQGGHSTTAATAGGNGGNVFLNYHGLIGSATVSTNNLSRVNLRGGNSTSALAGTNGATTLNKDSVCDLDADLSNNGIVDLADRVLIINRYANISTDPTFNVSYDIYCDNRHDVIDLSRVGFVTGRA